MKDYDNLKFACNMNYSTKKQVSVSPKSGPDPAMRFVKLFQDWERELFVSLQIVAGVLQANWPQIVHGLEAMNCSEFLAGKRQLSATLILQFLKKTCRDEIFISTRFLQELNFQTLLASRRPLRPNSRWSGSNSRKTTLNGRGKSYWTMILVVNGRKWEILQDRISVLVLP